MIWEFVVKKRLTLKVLITTTAENPLIFVIFFRENKTRQIKQIVSHEMSSLIFSEK